MANVKGFEKEKKVHDRLLNLLKEHFTEDEREILEGGEAMDDMKPMSHYEKMKRGRIFGGEDPDELMDEDQDQEDEEEDEEYRGKGRDDDYYEDLMENENDTDEDEKLPKEKRKDLAILVLTKKAGRKR